MHMFTVTMLLKCNDQTHRHARKMAKFNSTSLLCNDIFMPTALILWQNGSVKAFQADCIFIAFHLSVSQSGWDYSTPSVLL